MLKGRSLIRESIIISFAIALILFTSCQRDSLNLKEIMNTESDLKNGKVQTTDSEKLVLRVKPLTFKQIRNVAKKLEDRNKVKREDQLSANLIVPDVTQDEAEIQNVISPIVENGRQIYNELIPQIVNSLEWNQLSYEDKSAILNISEDSQFCDIALFYAETGIEYQNLSPDEIIAVNMSVDRIKDCVGVAIGVTAISDLLEQTGALMTKQTVIKSLKIIGRRYLSYIGIAWMLWDFVDCVDSSNGGSW
jgi:hypothetical protein